MRYRFRNGFGVVSDQLLCDNCSVAGYRSIIYRSIYIYIHASLSCLRNNRKIIYNIHVYINYCRSVYVRMYIGPTAVLTHHVKSITIHYTFKATEYYTYMQFTFARPLLVAVHCLSYIKYIIIVRYKCAFITILNYIVGLWILRETDIHAILKKKIFLKKMFEISYLLYFSFGLLQLSITKRQNHNIYVPSLALSSEN